jgi:hypothetical protein
VVATEDVRAEVDRLVHSRTFGGSEVHRKLLQYLAERTLSGEADRLKEYTVGLDAFGKPPSYDPRHDSIVRLQVGRLRQKLMAYYQTEATDDPVRIDLPKGGFKLSFEARNPVAESRPNSRWQRYLSIPLVLALLWAVGATLAWRDARRKAAAVATHWNPELEALWKPFLQSDRSVLVCLGTPLFVRFPRYGYFRDPRSNVWEEIEKSERVSALRKALDSNDVIASYAFTGAGEASAGFLIAKLLTTRVHDLQLTRSSLLSWQQIADQDVIFIGPPKFNLHLQVAALTQDLVVEADGIRNLRPRPGEPVFLEDRIAPGKVQEGETHALISRIPGLSGAGQILVIAGNASPDTLAAAEWLTQPARAVELVRKLRAGSGAIPRYFQVVIKVAFKQGVPLQSSYLFHHELRDPDRPDPKR